MPTAVRRGVKPGLRAVVAPPAPRPAAEGICTAIVGVTGVVDDVQDLVQPGAITESLRRRRPKVVHHHEWREDTGRVLHIEEWLPGDPRLPKTTPMGAPWPKDAGAIVCTIQFNLRTTRGREAFESVKFYAPSRESFWSIGYKVVPGMAAKRGDGVRVIYQLDLYEVSQVLHGAAPLTQTLEFKSATGTVPALETKQTLMGQLAKKAAAGPSVAGICVRAADTGRVLMLQRALDDEDPAAGSWEFPGGHLEDGETPLAGAQREWAEETGAQFPAGGQLTGQWDAGDVYRGHVWTVPAETDVQINAPHGDRDVSNPDDPDGDATEVVAWWTPATLQGNPAVREELASTLPDVYEALGAPLETKTAAMAVMEAKSLHAGSAGQVSVQSLGRAKRVPGQRRGEAKSAVAAARKASPLWPQMEVKAMAYMTGSWESRQSILKDAARDLLLPTDEGPVGNNSWVCLEATFDDHLFASACVDGETNTYRIDYTVTPAGVELGAPQPMELEVVAIGAASPVPEAEQLEMRVIPLVDALTDVGARVAAGPLEGKALQDAVRPAVLALLDQLAVKGAPAPLPGLPDTGQDDEDDVSEWDDESEDPDDDLDDDLDDGDATAHVPAPPPAPRTPAGGGDEFMPDYMRPRPAPADDVDDEQDDEELDPALEGKTVMSGEELRALLADLHS